MAKKAQRLSRASELMRVLVPREAAGGVTKSLNHVRQCRAKSVGGGGKASKAQAIPRGFGESGIGVREEKEAAHRSFLLGDLARARGGWVEPGECPRSHILVNLFRICTHFCVRIDPECRLGRIALQCRETIFTSIPPNWQAPPHISRSNPSHSDLITSSLSCIN